MLGLHLEFVSGTAVSPKRASLCVFPDVASLYGCACFLSIYLHSTYDGLDGSCSNFHFGREQL